MYLIPIPAFTDNYLRLLHDGKRALIVDPGDVGPQLSALQQHALPLEPILVTHPHADHTEVWTLCVTSPAPGSMVLPPKTFPSIYPGPRPSAGNCSQTRFCTPGKPLSWQLPAASTRRPMTTPRCLPSGTRKNQFK